MTLPQIPSDRSPPGSSDGIIQGSINGGSTFPYELHGFHHNNPARFTGTVTVDSFDLGGHSDVKIRYYYRSNDDWWWFFDNIVITACALALPKSRFLKAVL